MIDDDMIIWWSLSSAYSCDAMIKIKMMMMIPRYDMIRYTIVTKAKGVGRNANTKDVGKTTYSIGRSSEDTGDRICKDTLWHCTHFPHTLPATVIFFKNPANAIPIRLINGKSKTNIHQNSEKKSRDKHVTEQRKKIVCSCFPLSTRILPSCVVCFRFFVPARHVWQRTSDG